MSYTKFKNVKHTKKKRKRKNIQKLWDSFKIKENDHNMILLYSQQKTGLRHKCDLCDYPVSYSENKLLACTNKKCGVIYKDIM